jgi:hypothetical protein
MKLPFIKLYTRDWLCDKQLRLCSDAARGIWSDLLCLMADNEPYGYLEHNNQPLTEDQIIRLRGGDKGTVKGLIDELEANGIFSRDERGVIYSRRMVKDNEFRNKCTTAGKHGGNPALRILGEEDQNPEPRTHIRLTGTVKGTLKGEGGGLEHDELKQCEIFYKAYPKKKSQYLMQVAWARNNPERPPLNELLAKLEQQKRWSEWTKDGGRFIPNPDRYLSEGKWTDEESDQGVQDQLTPAEKRAAFEKRMSLDVSKLTPELQARMFSGK